MKVLRLAKFGSYFKQKDCFCGQSNSQGMDDVVQEDPVEYDIKKCSENP